MSIQITDLPDLSKTHLGASDAVAFAIKILEKALSLPRFSFRTASHGYYELRQNMPYVIHETTFENTYILVNRNYKPLGSNKATATDWVNYDEYTNLQVQMTKQQIESVSSPPHVGGLFGDGNPPWNNRATANAYLARLKLLYTLIST